MLPLWKSHIIKQLTGPDDPEFQAGLQEALCLVSPDDVIAIADELVERQRCLFADIKNNIADKVVPAPEVFFAVSHSRANALKLINYFSAGNLEKSGNADLFNELLNADGPAAERITRFAGKLELLDIRLVLELATGLLYNISPGEHWLWTRWLWDPATGTGALPLMAGSTHNLLSVSIADGYNRVGAVTALSSKFGESTGLYSTSLVSNENRALFANSTFLACVYSVYMYGAASWRLSREFNRLLPTLPAMARRLLGLKKTVSMNHLDQIKETI